MLNPLLQKLEELEKEDDRLYRLAINKSLEKRIKVQEKIMKVWKKISESPKAIKDYEERYSTDFYWE